MKISRRINSGFAEDIPASPIYQVSGAGQHVGLDVLFLVGKEDYVSYAKSYFGASVLVHGAERFPQGLDRVTVAQPGSDVNIAVIPSVVVSQDSIRGVGVGQRNCFFNDEVTILLTASAT